MTIFQGTEKMLTPYSKLYGKKVKHCSAALGKFYTKTKTKTNPKYLIFIFNMSNVLNYSRTNKH